MRVRRNKSEVKLTQKEMEKLLVDGPAGRNLQAWCRKMIAQRVNMLIVTLTQTVVRAVDGLYLLGKLVREGQTGWIKGSATTEEWERMYRRPDRTMHQALDQFATVPSGLTDLLGIPAECGPVCAGTAMRVVKLVSRSLQHEDPEVLNRECREYAQSPKGIETAQRSREVVASMFEMALSTPLAAEDDSNAVDESLKLPEIQFFVLVLLPCWLEYGESASLLLQRAETGDLQALEQLLRLDKRSIFFPRIRQLVEDASRNRIEGAFALHVEAFGGAPQTQWKRDVLRVGLSKFILCRSQAICAIHPELFGKPLRRQDIFDAFNAAARDQGSKRDQTLPIDEETFSKRITREKRFRTATPWDIFSV